MKQIYDSLNLSKDEEILASKIEDIVFASENKNCVKFSSFLDLRQQKIARFATSKTDNTVIFYGGFENSERNILGVFPNYVSQNEFEKLFPIEFLRVIHSREISHRDILGALMSLGIKRETVGDILVGEKKSFIVVNKAMSDYIIDNVSKIANVGVKIEKCSSEDLVVSNGRFEDLSMIISSMRCDCIVSALINKSRSIANGLIESERVFVNGESVCSASKKLCENDIVSIRSYGKFILGNPTGVTKKGNIVLPFKKYI